MAMVYARIHDLEEARRAVDRAREADEELVLVTAQDSAAFAGVGFWQAVTMALERPVVIDCGEDAGLAMGALRAGARDLLFTGPDEVAVKLEDMAGQLGGRLRRRLEDG